MVHLGHNSHMRKETVLTEEDGRFLGSSNLGLICNSLFYGMFQQLTGSQQYNLIRILTSNLGLTKTMLNYSTTENVGKPEFDLISVKLWKGVART